MSPLERKSLFWDTDVKKLDAKKDARYIIERVLSFGRDADVRWVWRTYDESLLRQVVKDSRSLDAKTKILWTLLLNK